MALARLAPYIHPEVLASHTTVPHPEHKTYKYLMRELLIDRPNRAWCADITDIPMRCGFLCRVAAMDRTTRKALI